MVRVNYSSLIRAQRAIKADALVLISQVEALEREIRGKDYSGAVQTLESRFFSFRPLRDLLAKFQDFLREEGTLEKEIGSATSDEELARLHMVRQMFHEKVNKERVFIADVLHELSRGEEIEQIVLKLKEQSQQQYAPRKQVYTGTDFTTSKVLETVKRIKTELISLSKTCDSIIATLNIEIAKLEIAVGRYSQSLGQLVDVQENLIAAVEKVISAPDTVRTELRGGRFVLHVIGTGGRERAQLRITASMANQCSYEYQMGFSDRFGTLSILPIEHTDKKPETIVDAFILKLKEK